MRESATLPLLLKELRLTTMLKSWERVATEIQEQGDGAIKYLQQLCELEVAARYTNRIKRMTSKSKLPPGKTLSSFDFTHATSIDSAQIKSLAECALWIQQAENVLIFGASGVGKSHVAMAIGHAAIERNIKVYFTETSKLVQELQLAKREFQLPKALAKLAKYPLLILDDIGYAKKDDGETNVLFDLIADRYESGSIIITANQPFSEWDAIFPDNMMAVAAIDRLVHHASIIKIEGVSYRKSHAKTQQHQNEPVISSAISSVETGVMS
jgi:DNA replication protein DnaC